MKEVVTSRPRGLERVFHLWLILHGQKGGSSVGKTKRGKGTKIMAWPPWQSQILVVLYYLSQSNQHLDFHTDDGESFVYVEVDEINTTSKSGVVLPEAGDFIHQIQESFFTTRQIATDLLQ